MQLVYASKHDFAEGLCLLDPEPTQAPPGHVVIHDNLKNRVLDYHFGESKDAWSFVWDFLKSVPEELQSAENIKIAAPKENSDALVAKALSSG